MAQGQPKTRNEHGTFIGNVNVVMLTYAADGVLAFLTGALIARELGPEGRGAYAIFIVTAAFGQLVLGFGAGNAAIYFLNKRELQLREILSAMHIVVLFSIPITALMVLAVIPASAAGIAAVTPWDGGKVFGADIPPWLLVLAVPAILYMNLLRLTLQALNRFVDLGITTVGQQSILLALVAVTAATGVRTPELFVSFLIVASAGAALYALVRIGLRNLDLAHIISPRWPTLRALIRFGAQGEAGNVLQLLNYRLDQYIVAAYVSVAGVGIYAVSASMTEAVFILANAVALVLMPRLTSAHPEDAARMAPMASRNTMLIAAGGALALAAIAPVLIPFGFGEKYESSVQALWWLLPGTVALTGSKVLTSYIFSQGKPLVNTLITLVSLVVTVGADFALIPVFGVNGAAAASSLAYGAHFAAALVAYRWLSGQPILAAVVPQRRDVDLYVEASRSVLGRHSQRAPAEVEAAVE